MKLGNLCSLSSLISIAFIIGMIFMTLTVNKRALSEQLLSQLTHTERNEYAERVRERQTIYFSGYSLGVALSFAIMYLMPQYATVSFVAATAFITTYFYYILMPKKPLIVTQLSSQKARDAWQRVYREMQVGYHGGLALGIAAVAIFASQRC